MEGAELLVMKGAAMSNSGQVGAATELLEDRGCQHSVGPTQLTSGACH